MNKPILALIFLTVSAGVGALLAQKAPPDHLVFQTKMGNVTFQHAEHVKRVKADCAACHDKLFQKDATAPLNFKAALHKTAETGKTSCGGCHNPGGPSFATANNCAKCHVK